MTNSRSFTCEECSTDVQYVGGGKLPKLCVRCRSLPDVLKRKAKEADERAKAKAQARVDELMKRMEKK